VSRTSRTLGGLHRGPLGEREFRLLFTGQAMSVIGDGIGPIAVAFAVLDLTGSATDLGLVLTAAYLPMAAFLLVGGVWADRVPRRAVMLAADAIRAVTQATTGALLLSGRARLWELIVLQVIYGVAAAFFSPASTALVPATAPPGQLQAANALLGICGNFGFTLGPALGGVVVATAGPGAAFVVDAGTFVWSAAFLASMRPRRLVPPPRQSFVRDLVDGYREVRAQRWIWVSILSVGLALMIYDAPIQVLGPVVARRHLGGAGAWAAIEAALGAGTVAGGATALRVALRRPLRFVNVCFLLCAPGSIALGIPAPLAVIVVLQFLAGWSIGLYVPVWDTLVQERVPANVLSRVSAYDWTGSLAFMPLGFAAAGPVASAIGIRATLICGGIWCAISVAVMLSVRDIRNLERVPAEPGIAA
jgi:MFS family permease